MARRRKNGVPLWERGVQFNSRQTGRLTHLEYNVIDMHYKLGSTNMIELASYVNMTREAAERMVSRMRHTGIVTPTSTPSAFAFTAEALAAFREADDWMLMPSTRPRPAASYVPAPLLGQLSFG